MSARTEGDTQHVIRRRYDLFNRDSVLSMGYAYSLQLDLNTKPSALPENHVPPALVDKI